VLNIPYLNLYRSSGNGDGNGRHSLQRSKMPYYADCHGDWAGEMLSLSVGLWNRNGDEDGEMPYDDRSGSSDDRFISN